MLCFTTETRKEGTFRAYLRFCDDCKKEFVEERLDLFARCLRDCIICHHGDQEIFDIEDCCAHGYKDEKKILKVGTVFTSPEMTTLEARYFERIAEFAARKQEASACGHQDALRQVEDEELDYMLRAAPFIQEYSSGGREPVAKPVAMGLDKFVNVIGKTRKNEVFTKYLMFVENEAVDDGCFERIYPRDDPQREFVCESCDGGMVADTRESVMVCRKCGIQKPYVGLSEANLSYQEEISQNMVSSFSYKRLNHFSEWLNSIQAKVSTDIPEDVIDAIRAEFKKSRTSLRSQITPPKVRQYMKKLNLNKLYEHAHHVCTLINGVPAPSLEPELEERLKHMFVAIQQPFERAIKGTTRKNFLSYSFVLFKMAELLGRDDLLCHFSLLKSAEKLYQQDVIWKKICAELGWEFVRSV